MHPRDRTWRRAKFVAAWIGVWLACPLSLHAEVIIEVVFSGVTTGTVTYAEIGDEEPTSFTFSKGADTWADGAINPISPFETVWSGGQVASMSPAMESDGVHCLFYMLDYINFYTASSDLGHEGDCYEPPEEGTFMIVSPPSSVPALPLAGVALLVSGLVAVGARNAMRTRTSRRDAVAR